MSSSRGSRSSPPTAPRMRWSPLFVILGLSAVTVIGIWNFYDSNRQRQFMWTGGVLVVALLLTLVWLLFFSGLRWRTRLISLTILMMSLALPAVLFRVRGLSGDVLPLLEWRWAARDLPPLPGKTATTPDTISTAAEISPVSSTSLSNTQSPRAEPSSLPAEGSPSSPRPDQTKAFTEEISSAHDFPQFLGPDRDARVLDLKLVRDWNAHPPRQVWRQPVGAGWSAFAVAGNSAITLEQRDSLEMAVCYELQTGRVKWSRADSTAYLSNITGNGPRATPTIANGRVYTLGGTGKLNCLDLNTGSRLWSKNILTDNNAASPSWGMSGSPLIVDSLVVVSAGGSDGKSLVAYHKDTGERMWSAGDDRAGYSSPLITTLAGFRQILIFNRGNVVAHDPASGAILWQQPWTNETESVAQPVPLSGDRVFVASGYGVGCKLFHIQRKDESDWQVALLWETKNLKAKFSNVVHRDGFIYGLDDGILVCLDLADGRRRWKAGRYGHGQVLLVDDLLLVQAESGEVALVEANPEKHVELARFAALEGKTWNNPALAGRYLLVRNDREAACYELAVE